MKKLILPLIAASALSACTSIYVPTLQKVAVPSSSSETQGLSATPANPASAYRLSDKHWSDVAKMKDEVNRLVTLMQEGKLTKVQAVKKLNQFRMNLVGSNLVDDSVYEVYYRSTVRSQKGSISSEQSREDLKEELKKWQKLWIALDDSKKPSNPAFTNFWLKHFDMKPLQ